MLDRPKFIKLMMMTSSSNDGEALTALRKANAALAADNLNWSDFITGLKPSRPVTQPRGRGTVDDFHDSVDAFRKASARHEKFSDPKIPNMLASLLRDARGGFHDFVESVDSYWREHGYLTERQFEAIVNAYERSK